MDWVQDMAARWVRIMTAAGGDGTPLDAAVAQIGAIGQAHGKKSRFGGRKRNDAVPAEASAVTVLCRQLIAGVLISDLMIDQACGLTGQSREQLLNQLSSDLPRQIRDQQLRALQAELSGSCAQLRDPERPPYAGLGRRIEELLKLAEVEASALIDQARAEAAEITSAAARGTGLPDPDHAAGTEDHDG
jgi:hypothetical protein